MPVIAVPGGATASPRGEQTLLTGAAPLGQFRNMPNGGAIGGERRWWGRGRGRYLLAPRDRRNMCQRSSRPFLPAHGGLVMLSVSAQAHRHGGEADARNEDGAHHCLRLMKITPRRKPAA